MGIWIAGWRRRLWESEGQRLGIMQGEGIENRVLEVIIAEGFPDRVGMYLDVSLWYVDLVS